MPKIGRHARTEPLLQESSELSFNSVNYAPKHEKERPSLFGSILGFLFMLVCVVLLSWVLRAFVFQAYEIPSGSMEQTIQIGDMVFSEKLSYYFREPQYADIVTFVDPNDSDRILIKRCIAVQGQIVDINDYDGKVYVDGLALSEDSYTGGTQSYSLNSDIVYPYTVPEGCIWVMGDNRNNSQDSRYFGAIPLSSVTGRAAIIYWPLEDFGLL